MAAKQALTKTVDWSQLIQRTTAKTKPRILAFKNKTEAIVAANIKAKERDTTIDWNYYQSTISDKALVADFKKKFEAFQVPKPKDTKSSAIAAKEKEDQALTKKFIADADQEIEVLRVNLTRLLSLPSVEQLTMDDIMEHFPQTRPNYKKYPYWPHWGVKEMERMHE